MTVALAPQTDLSPQLRSRYLSNLAALYQSDPTLAARLEALPFATLPTLERTRSGRFTTRLSADDGGVLYLHSRRDPAAEASHLAAAQPESEQPAFFLSGLGLGYAVEAFDRRFGHPLLIAAEDDLSLLKAAFCVSDLAGPLREQRLVFVTDADKAVLHAGLSRRTAELLLGMQIVALPHAQRYHRPFHTAVLAALRDFLTYARMQTVTLLRNARITCQNIAFNLPTYLSQPGIGPLRGRFAGYPAILVAAGPSLARDLDELAGLRGRVVLIAVQTVFRTLLAHGIRPHFVTSLDFHEISAQFFHGVAEAGDTILVAEPKATWHVPDRYPGPIRMLHAQFADDLLRDAAPRRAGLKAGATVAHLSFYLAQYLGCDPLILVGQDLCFPEGIYYPPGLPIEETWQPELGRFQTLEMKQWERIARARAILRRVSDVRGRPTYTDEQMLTYAEQFQTDFASAPQRIIHATQTGLPLAGTEVLPLTAAAERYCVRPLPADLLAAAADTVEPAESATQRERAAAALDARLREVAQLRGLAAEMSKLLAQLAACLDRPTEFNRVLVRVDDLRVRIQRYEQTYRIVTAVSQAAELRRVTADRKLASAERETRATAAERLARDREFVDSFIVGCDWLSDMLPEAARRLREPVS